MSRTRTQVAVIGAGPAGLLLSHLLHLQGIDSVVVEARSRDHVERRVRAGILEHPVVELLREVGLGDRLDREGLTHGGIALRSDGVSHRIDFDRLVGRAVTVYGQQEVVKDLIAARVEAGGDLRFEVSDVRPEGFLDDRPRVRFRQDGHEVEVDCDLIVGADGSHGVSRAALPEGSRSVLTR